MTQLRKVVLLFLGCVLLASVSGCGSSSTTTLPNGLLFAANTSRPGSVSALTVTTGALGFVSGSPFATTGNSPLTLAAASNKFLYAGLPTSGGVVATVLGKPAAAGAPGGVLLMPIRTNDALETPQLFASGGDYGIIAVTPSGNALYAADQTNNQLAAFSIDSSKGTLTAIGPQGPPAGLPVGFDPFSIAIDPMGKFVFVANCDCTNSHNQGSVSVFQINQADGTLSAHGLPLLLNGGTAHPSALAISPDSKFLFVASLDDMVYVESIAADGTLTDVPCANQFPSPCALPPGSRPVAIALSFDGGNSVYTGNAESDTVSFFLNCLQTPLPIVATTSQGCPTDANGNALAPLVFQSNSPVGGTVGAVVADPTSIAANSATGAAAIAVGHFLYVTDYDHGTITVFSVTSTTTCTNISCPTTAGTLTMIGSGVPTGGAKPYGLAVVPLATSQ